MSEQRAGAAATRRAQELLLMGASVGTDASSARSIDLRRSGRPGGVPTSAGRWVARGPHGYARLTSPIPVTVGAELRIF